MKRIIDVINPHPRKRLGLMSGTVLLGFAIGVTACSSDGSPVRTVTTAATTTDATVATSDLPPTITGPVAEESAPATAETVPPTTAQTPPVAQRNEVDVDALVEELEIRGFDGVVAVRDGSDVVTGVSGLADRENDVPIDAETVFDIGSISKQFTAAAILHLEMDGRLAVDDTLGEHVPGLPEGTAAITLHELLTHTSGVPNALGPDEEPIGRSDFLARVGETALVSEPGDRYAYSNVGHALLAAVIEFETGEPYEVYLRTELLEPAGMLDTGYVLPDWDGHTIAVGYADPAGDRFGRPNEQPWDVDGPFWNLRGNGGLLSTAADMLRWDQALLGDQVLDAEAKAKFFAPHVPVEPGAEINYGYGWLIVPTPMGTPLIFHDGGNGIFSADFLRFVDQDLTIFVATNSFQDDDSDIASDVANHVLAGSLTAILVSEDDDG